MRIAIVRPCFVLACSKTGVYNGDDYVARCLKASVQLGIRPDWQMGGLFLSPVDFVAAFTGAVAVAKVPLPGCVYHPAAEKPLKWGALFDGIESAGYSLETVSHSEWYARQAKSIGGGQDDNALTPLMVVLSPEKYNGMTSDIMPVGTSRTHAILSDIGVSEPSVMDTAQCRAQADFFRQSGYFPGPNGAPAENTRAMIVRTSTVQQ
ncbi:hypothetical protein KIPB_006416 [Kipferlia bialata]|uniref:Thioester reductase (TE) domain-containing protein n=2 Tax=Kipferlia bialata TaxID=797122 RepID=A0A391NMB2_9EUKA|nr:hypothetical protein KIPB_006416 [Kipferlia bialata]|eukprot:g6416.t1